MLCLIGIGGPKAHAQSFAREIADAARESVARLDSARIPDAEQSRQEFLSAIEAFRRHLRRTTNEDNAAAWIRYLEIESAEEAIESDLGDRAIAAQAVGVARRATGLHPGLEVAAIRRLRQAAERYSDALRFRRKDRTIKALAVQLDRFADQLDDRDGKPDVGQQATLQLLLDLLTRTEQSVPLVSRSVELYGSPNLSLTVSESMVQRVVQRPINRRNPVRDCILGTYVVGDADLRGKLSATLLPSPDSVRIRLALDGTIHSDSVGYNGPVRLKSTGIGQVHASRVLEIKETDVAMEPVQATGSLTTRINRIEHRLRLVRKIARKKAAQQKPLAEAIARGKMIRRVSEGFDEDLRKQLSQLTSDPSAASDRIGNVRRWLQRLDLAEPTRSIRSTADSLSAQVTVRQAAQLASAVPPPSVQPLSEITIQLQESLINNTLGATLAGRTMSRDQLADLVQLATPDAEASDGDQPNFEIDFDAARPIIFEANQGKLRIGIRGTRFFSEGKRELKERLEVAATFTPWRTDNGRVILKREGDVEINFPGTKRLSTLQTSKRVPIQEAFADAFPEQLLDEPIVAPETIKLDALRDRMLKLVHFNAENSWLTLGFNESESPAGE
jgi:hypothetical protein